MFATLSRQSLNNPDIPFRPLDPSPMSSNYSDPRGRSPQPSAPPRSPYALNRSATSPVPPPVSSPSPNMFSNMDSAFPRFPTNRGTPRSTRPQERDRLDSSYNQRYAEPSPLFAPLSPRTNGGENVSKRLNSIAPGPFDSRRPSTASAPKSPSQEPVYGHRRMETQGSMGSVGSGSKSRTSLASSTSRASAYSNRSAGLPSRTKPGPTTAMPPPPLPAAEEESEGIDAFLGRLQSEVGRPGQLTQDDRAKTYPLRKESQERRGPPPRPRRPSEKDLPPANIAEYKTSDFAPRSSNMFPSHNTSRTESEADLQRDLAPARSLQPPPPVKTNYNIDTPSVPLHTPSDSGLSDDSYASYTTRSVASSRSSPPSSEAGHSRNASKVNRSEYLAEGSSQRTASPDSYVESKPLPSQAQGRRPPASYTRPNQSEPIPQILSPGFPSPSAPESPMDPAIQLGESFERRPKEQLAPQDPAFNLAQSPPRRKPEFEPRQPESRRPTPASKGNCRGCSEPIVGKSVKDSSGRLTGRYHRSCFVCRTCGDGFPTAEFYVFENAPYCEHHYHRLNGSLCRSCNRGIEGQYLETDTYEKFHPRCFTCSTCRVPLSADYYEVGGQKFCERHGQRAAAPRQNYLGPGDYRPRNVQKRRTRLMMM